MYPHVIRLDGPWEYRTAGGVVRRKRMTLKNFPGNEPTQTVWGNVELARRFHWPGQLDQEESVWLLIDRAIGRTTVTLNGHILGIQANPWGCFARDITSFSRPTNLLELSIIAPDYAEQNWLAYGSLGIRDATSDRLPVGGLVDGVWLEVRSRFLEVRRPRVLGEWRGTAGRFVAQGECRWRSSAEVASAKLRIGLELATEVVAEHQIGVGAEWTAFAFEFGPVAGEPRRVIPLVMSFRRAGQPLYEFHRTIRWTRGGPDVIHVIGQYPEEALYDFCDKSTAFSIDQDLLPPVELTPSGPEVLMPGRSTATAWDDLWEVLCRQASHPCLRRWRFCNQVNWPAPVEDEVLRIIRAVDSSRVF